MKRLFIFAMMTLAASSSFAMSDILFCTNGRVEVTTARYMNDEKNLRLSANFLRPGARTFHSVVTSKGSLFGGQRTFIGKSTNGRSVKFVVENNDGLQGTLKIQGLADEDGIFCREPNLLEM